MSYQTLNDELCNSFPTPSAKDDLKNKIDQARPFFLGFISVTFVVFISFFLFTTNVDFQKFRRPVSAFITYSSLSDTKKVALFETFKTDYSKSYSTEDTENTAYANFLNFLELVDDRNSAELAAGGSSIHGVTKFADLSQEDFEKNYLGYAAPTESDFLRTDGPQLVAKNGDNFAVVDYSEDAAYLNDWIGVLTTTIKDQGYCGSCWAFSAVQQLESDAIIAGLMDINSTLSVQQVVSCSTAGAAGCAGGAPESAYNYVYTAGGLQMEDSYAYTSSEGLMDSCANDQKQYTVALGTGDYYTLSSEEEMVEHVLTYGPVSVCLDASNWNTYVKGEMTVCGSTINHCVQAVGVNKDNEHWTIRNSWGTDWGDYISLAGGAGYIKLQLNTNACNLAAMPTFTVPTAVA